MSELRVAAFTKFAKESEKTIVTLLKLVPKTYFSQFNRRWLLFYPRLPRTLQI